MDAIDEIRDSYVLERDRIRALRSEKVLPFWKAWWEEEKKRK